MKLLPWAWWKLSLLWLLNLKTRTPPSKRSGLFASALKVAVFGLALGIAALSLTLAIVSGFQNSLAKAVSNAQGGVVHFMEWRSASELRELSQLERAGVREIDWIWTTQGLLVGSKAGRGVMIEGRKRFLGKTPFSEPEQGNVQIHLGAALAELLGVKVGDSLKVLLPGILKRAIPLRVDKILKFGMYDVDSRLALIDQDSLELYLQENAPEVLKKRPGAAHGIRYYFSEDKIGIDKPYIQNWAQSYKDKVKKMDSFDHSSITIKTWAEQQKNLFGSIGMDKSLLTVIVSLLSLVATLNVAAILVVLFLERDKEIGILRALGMDRFSLIQWIGVQGLWIGLVSSVLGLLGAYFGGRFLLSLPIAELPESVYNLSVLPLYFSFKEQSFVVLFGIGTSVVLSLLVARSLASHKILELLGRRGS